MHCYTSRQLHLSIGRLNLCFSKPHELVKVSQVYSSPHALINPLQSTITNSSYYLTLSDSFLQSLDFVKRITAMSPTTTMLMNAAVSPQITTMVKGFVSPPTSTCYDSFLPMNTCWTCLIHFHLIIYMHCFMNMCLTYFFHFHFNMWLPGLLLMFTLLHTWGFSIYKLVVTW